MEAHKEDPNFEMCNMEPEAVISTRSTHQGGTLNTMGASNLQSHDPDHNPRDRWSSRWTFILASMGSAIGLGNFWRFPYLVYRWGGGTFLIPYVLSLLFIGIPMLFLEISLGQKMQKGDIACFGNIHPKLRGVGVASVFATFIIVTYYTSIIAWTLVYSLQSFYVPLPRGPGGDEPPNTEACQAAFGGSAAKYHLFHTTLHNFRADCSRVGFNPGESEGIAGFVYLAVAIVWVIATLCVWKGVKTASFVVWVTMPLPFILLAILMIRGLTLDGADIGIAAYLGNWDMSLLSDPGIWTDAAGQIFFSLSVCLGVMTSYGSYNSKDSPMTANIFIIAISNSVFSFLCGFAVFGTLGFLAKQQGVSVDEVASASITLAFVTYPSALVQLDGANFWCIITFVTLFLLGIDSAFSMLEAITTVICDAQRDGISIELWVERKLGDHRKGWGKPFITSVVALVGLLCGLLFTADVGLYWLDILDHYINNYTVLIDGLMEAICVSWVWGYIKNARQVNRKSAMWFAWTYIAAGAAFVILSASLATVMAPCANTAWELGSVNATTTYKCGLDDRVCDFRETMINDVAYYAGSAKIWSQCPQFARMGDSETLVLVPLADAEDCVRPTGEFCTTGGEIIIAFVVFFLILVVGWIQSWKASRLTVRQWFAAFALSGADELMAHITWVDRDRKTGLPLGMGRRTTDFFGCLFSLTWRFLIKYVVPLALTVLLVNVFKKDVQTPYEGYPGYMHAVCWAMVAFSLVLFGYFLVLPGDWPEEQEAPCSVTPEAHEDHVQNGGPSSSGRRPV
mmetsp:Transcript_139792/g.243374  ORF Transcript_139792/g.243374 Transcript_139792/m.243374 type:complete len:795 (-) Transcript_139792:289-2673(-)